VFHLGWFLGNGFGIQPWTTAGGHHPFAGNNGRDWMTPDLYIDLAKDLERGGFDYILIEDTSMIEDTYGSSSEFTLKHGIMAPKNDPMPLIPIMARESKHIGIIGTVSTIQYPPFLAARLMTTLDHLTEGRAGVNVVTSVTHRVAQNFGYDQHLPHDERYAMADEWMDAVSQLWESWAPDAVLLDQAEPRYADYTKVNPINFEGKYFKVRGPLNTIPGPQRRPVIAQAGNSPVGRDLAAKHADTMLAMGHTVEQMRELREDMHRRLLSFGRKPDDFKILFLVTPVVGSTDAEAQEKKRIQQSFIGSDLHIQELLWGLSYVSGGEVDYSTFDLDGPMPMLKGNGEQSSLAQYTKGSEGMTLREVILKKQQIGDLGLVGAPDTIAGKMGEIMDDVGGDGFLIYSEMTRHTISLFADGVGPALQRRGLIRDGFSKKTFRENLLEF
jgi:FMN-dependent oxidoreductase (nitrilotriacetate monooxygenase family)